MSNLENMKDKLFSLYAKTLPLPDTARNNMQQFLILLIGQLWIAENFLELSPLTRQLLIDTVMESLQQVEALINQYN
jgi:hypothetical protein